MHARFQDKKMSHAVRQYVAYENKQRAEERHQEALRRLAMDKAYREYEETKHVRDRLVFALLIFVLFASFSLSLSFY